MSTDGNWRVDQILDELAWFQLHRKGSVYALQYPKLACYAYDHISHAINLKGAYEKPYLETLRGIIGDSMKGKALIDVGANIGNHSLYLSSSFKQVWALEPHPSTFRLLQMNADLVSNVKALNYGASETVTTMKAVGSLSNMGSVRVVDHPEDLNDHRLGPQVELRLVPLDSLTLLREDMPIGLVKIDVEGHELNVLRGAASLLRQNMPLVCFEQNSEDINGGSSKAIEFLRSLGYTAFYHIQAGKRRWSAKRLPPALRRAARLMELLLWKDATQKAVLKEIKNLEKIDYPMVIASAERLTAVQAKP